LHLAGNRKNPKSSRSNQGGTSSAASLYAQKQVFSAPVTAVSHDVNQQALEKIRDGLKEYAALWPQIGKGELAPEVEKFARRTGEARSICGMGLGPAKPADYNLLCGDAAAPLGVLQMEIEDLPTISLFVTDPLTKGVGACLLESAVQRSASLGAEGKLTVLADFDDARAIYRYFGFEEGDGDEMMLDPAKSDKWRNVGSEWRLVNPDGSLKTVAPKLGASAAAPKAIRDPRGVERSGGTRESAEVNSPTEGDRSVTEVDFGAARDALRALSNSVKPIERPDPECAMTEKEEEMANRLYDTKLVCDMGLSGKASSAHFVCGNIDSPLGALWLDRRHKAIDVPCIAVFVTSPETRGTGAYLLEAAVHKSVEMGAEGKLIVAPLSGSERAYEALGFAEEKGIYTLTPSKSDKWRLEEGKWRIVDSDGKLRTATSSPVADKKSGSKQRAAEFDAISIASSAKSAGSARSRNSEALRTAWNSAARGLKMVGKAGAEAALELMYGGGHGHWSPSEPKETASDRVVARLGWHQSREDASRYWENKANANNLEGELAREEIARSASEAAKRPPGGGDAMFVFGVAAGASRPTPARYKQPAQWATSSTGPTAARESVPQPTAVARPQRTSPSPSVTTADIEPVLNELGIPFAPVAAARVENFWAPVSHRVTDEEANQVVAQILREAEEEQINMVEALPVANNPLPGRASSAGPAKQMERA
jgi:GNAT superfamily N-acetyltransferase